MLQRCDQHNSTRVYAPCDSGPTDSAAAAATALGLLFVSSWLTLTMSASAVRPSESSAVKQFACVDACGPDGLRWQCSTLPALRAAPQARATGAHSRRAAAGLSVSLRRGLSKTYFQKHAASEPAAEGGDVVHLSPMKQTHSDGQLTYMLNRGEKSRAIEKLHIPTRVYMCVSDSFDRMLSTTYVG